MQVDAAAVLTLDKLTELGYRLTNIYGDGAMRVQEGTVSVFIHPNGNVSPPHTATTLLAQVSLHEAGFTITYGRHTTALG